MTNCKSQTTNKSAGFTMVEVVVMLSIITAISGIVLASFTGLNEGAILTRSSRELALAIRRAQNMSLAVTQLEVGSPPTPQIPPAVGLFLSLADQSRYFLFADLAPADFKYAGESEKIGNTEGVFERGVRINRMVGSSGPYTSLHILFSAPEAILRLTDAAGVEIPDDAVDVELTTPSGQLKRTLTIRVSGQISIK